MTALARYAIESIVKMTAWTPPMKMLNASQQTAGIGIQIGISTDKLHARGPMGLEELTTYKYTVTGDGVIRA